GRALPAAGAGAGHRDGAGRGAAGRDDQERRQDHRAGSRPSRRPGHARRADGHRPDIPGDRALPADRAGGRGMTGPAKANGQANGQLDGQANGQLGERATPKRGPGPAPGSNVGPARFMGGMSTEKALDFRASSKRLLRMLSPQRPLIVTALVMGVVSVALSVMGPKVLGNVTNLVFSGYISSKIPAGLTQAEFVARLRATGHTTQAKLIGALHMTPGQGIDFNLVG